MALSANEYAYQRLQQMVRAGLLQGMPEPGPGGYASEWRQQSQHIGAPAAAAGYQDPGAFLRQGGQPRVAGSVGGLPQAQPGGDVMAHLASLIAVLPRPQLHPQFDPAPAPQIAGAIGGLPGGGTPASPIANLIAAILSQMHAAQPTARPV